MKLEKYISLLIAFVILVSNIDLAINLHYCMDEVASVSVKPFFASESEIDSCCDVQDEPPTCCNDRLVKLEKKSPEYFQNAPDFHFEAVKQISTFIYFKETNWVVSNSSNPLDYYCDTNPPPLFKLYNQMLFYA
jgi:hypothetical protein